LEKGRLILELKSFIYGKTVAETIKLQRNFKTAKPKILHFLLEVQLYKLIPKPGWQLKITVKQFALAGSRSRSSSRPVKMLGFLGRNAEWFARPDFWVHSTFAALSQVGTEP
jgi:hypothetical protein